MRNGVVADTLRHAGLAYKMVFGLNILQIAEIASTLPRSAELAEELWADSRTRESMLLAPMIYPPELLPPGRALSMLRESPTTEVSDILCHRLLRHIGDSFEIGLEAAADPHELTRYGGLRLLSNLLYSRSTEIEPIALAHLSDESPLCRNISRQMIDEIEFLKQ